MAARPKKQTKPKTKRDESSGGVARKHAKKPRVAAQESVPGQQPPLPPKSRGVKRKKAPPLPQEVQRLRDQAAKQHRSDARARRTTMSHEPKPLEPEIDVSNAGTFNARVGAEFARRMLGYNPSAETSLRVMLALVTVRRHAPGRFRPDFAALLEKRALETLRLTAPSDALPRLRELMPRQFVATADAIAEERLAECEAWNCAARLLEFAYLKRVPLCLRMRYFFTSSSHHRNLSCTIVKFTRVGNSKRPKLVLHVPEAQHIATRPSAPSDSRWLTATLSKTQPVQVELEDLLDRDPALGGHILDKPTEPTTFIPTLLAGGKNEREKVRDVSYLLAFEELMHPFVLHELTQDPTSACAGLRVVIGEIASYLSRAYTREGNAPGQVVVHELTNRHNDFLGFYRVLRPLRMRQALAPFELPPLVVDTITSFVTGEPKKDLEAKTDELTAFLDAKAKELTEDVTDDTASDVD